MKIPNQNDPDDRVTIIKSEEHRGLVWLAIGAPDKRSRHAHLRPAEAKAVAYALLSYAEQVSAVDR
jgi:hypothetical protein